jgi:hypothetical protein
MADQAISIYGLRNYPARKLISWLTAKVLLRGLSGGFSQFQWTCAISSGIDSRAVGQRSHKSLKICIQSSPADWRKPNHG